MTRSRFLLIATALSALAATARDTLVDTGRR